MTTLVSNMFGFRSCANLWVAVWMHVHMLWVCLCVVLFILPSLSQEALRKPSRRLVCESSNKGLTLQNAGRFSASWFILFNDVLVHAQVNSVWHQITPLCIFHYRPLFHFNHMHFFLFVFIHSGKHSFKEACEYYVFKNYFIF